MSTGVFGGSFDPPHAGHLIVAQEARVRLGLDRVILVPAAVPPHKLDRELTAPEVRVEMLRAATAGDDGFEVSEVELRRSGPSYTVDTLRELGGDGRYGRLHLLMGADQFQEFHTWREQEEILRLAEVVVLSRAGLEIEEPAASLPHRRLEVPRIEISATGIRRRVGEGLPIRYLVPSAVERIIAARSLYQ